MKAPRCRLCEKEHWGLCVVEKASVVKELREKVANIAPMVANVEETVANEPKVIANTVANKTKHGVYADKEKRRTYQRDLMRKRRAV